MHTLHLLKSLRGALEIEDNTKSIICGGKFFIWDFIHKKNTVFVHLSKSYKKK